MANIEDILTITIVLFVVGVAILFIVKAGHEINDNLKIVPTFNNTPEAVEVISSTDEALNMSDYIYLALFLAFFIGLIVTAYFIGGTPIVAPIYFFILITFTFVATIVQVVWNQVSTNANTITTAAQLPITNFILSNIGYLTAIMGLVAIIVMFSKPEDSA